MPCLIYFNDIVSCSMNSRLISAEYLLPEINFSFSKSSGPGGQHVNKVNTKVELRFDILSSKLLTHEEKELLLTNLSSKLTNKNVLILTAQGSRSQLANKEEVLAKLTNLLVNAFSKRKKRITTKPTKAAVFKRLENKKLHSLKKANRRKL